MKRILTILLLMCALGSVAQIVPNVQPTGTSSALWQQKSGFDFLNYLGVPLAPSPYPDSSSKGGIYFDTITGQLKINLGNGYTPIGGGGGGTGTVTSITAGGGLSGGTITASGTISMPSVGTAGVKGSSSLIPVFTTDVYGRVISCTNTAIAVDTGNIPNFYLKVRSELSANGGVAYNNTTGVFALDYTNAGTFTNAVWHGTAIADGYIASAATWNAKQSALTFSAGIANVSGSVTLDYTYAGTFTNATWHGVPVVDAYIASSATWNAKQAALNGTGLVRMAGTSVGYDNSVYLTGVVESNITLSDVTTDNATTLAHGFLKKLNGNASYYMGGDGNWDLLPASGTGTVTSVSLGNLSPLFTSTGSPVTTSGTLGFSLSTAAAHTVWGNNTGSTAAPSYFTLASADIPTLTNGQVGTSGLSATGTPSSSTVLRGDNTWATYFMGTVTSVGSGTGLTGGPINGSGSLSIATTGVTANSYVFGSFTVNAQGQLTAASNGAAASGSTNGYLSSTDWNTFNNKQAAGSYIILSSLSSTAPVSYNNTTGVFSMAPASGSANGYLSSSDWTTFNNKVSATGATFTGGVIIPVLSVNNQTGTTYTLVLTDAGKEITSNNSSAVTFTVPTNSSVAFATDTYIPLENYGAGKLTIAAASGVTINSDAGYLSITQYKGGYLHKIGTNTWILLGGISN